jgi:glucosyl-dolichyl phosphate glucuronosyltransferase
MTVSRNPLLSIVITSYTLERLSDTFKLLDGLKSQTYSNVEIIMVVEGSDRLFNEIQSYICKIELNNTKLIFNNGEKGASISRNLGVKEAKGEIIAFIDDDAVPFPDWAGMMVKSYSSDNIIGVTGPALPLWEDEKDAWFPKELHWIFSCTSWFECNEIVNVRHAWFENASFRKEAFDIAGYLDTTIGPHDSAEGFKSTEFKKMVIAEDLEISLRIKDKTGKNIIYNPQVQVWHKVDKKRLKLSYIRKWSFWTGLSKRKLKGFYPQKDNVILEPEHQLLKHIVNRLPVDILKSFFTHPVIAWRKLEVTTTVLVYVCLGYCSLKK